MPPSIRLHALASDGAFDPAGQFHRAPFDMQHDIAVLKQLFEQRVLGLMVKHKRLSERMREEILAPSPRLRPRKREDCPDWDEADADDDSQAA